MTECFFTNSKTLFEKSDIFPVIGMTDGERIDTLLRLSLFISFVMASFFDLTEAFVFFSISFMLISLIFTKVEYIKIETPS